MSEEYTSQPYAFALQDQSVVLKTTLDKFALKTDEYDYEEDIFAQKIQDNNAESNQQKEGQNSYGLYGLMQPPYPTKMLATLAEINTYHSAAVKTKAVDAGGLGWKIVPLTDNAKPADKLRLEQFFQNCRPTFEDVATRAFQDEEEIGWLTIELIRTAGLQTGEPQRLEHVPSHTVRIHKDANRFMQTWDNTHNTWYKLIGDYRSVTDRQDKDINVEDGSEHPFNSLDAKDAAHELIYDINYSARSTYYGIPDSVPAIRTMLGDQSAVNYNLSFFKNFAVPAYAVYITGNFQDEKLKDADGNVVLDKNGKPISVMQRAMEEKLREVNRNPNGPMLFMIPTRGGPDSQPVQITFEKLAVEQKDNSFRLYRMDARDEIISAHRVDPYRAMIVQTGSLGGNTSIETKKNYKSTTIKPKQRRLEALININIIWADSPKGFGITDWALKLEEIDTDDESHEMDMDKALFMMGGLTPFQLISKWSNRTGVTVPDELKDDPALNAYYVNNVAITNVPEQPQQNLPVDAVKIIEDMAVKLDAESKGLGDAIRGLINGS